MAYRLTIGGRDYSNYVYNQAQPLTMNWDLNRPKVLLFGLLSTDNTFGGLGIPKREEQIILDTLKFGANTFKGFISAHPDMTVVGYQGDMLFTVRSATRTTLEIDETLLPNQWFNYTIRILEGPGTGQTATILNNTDHKIQLMTPLMTIPDGGVKASVGFPVYAMKIACSSEEYQLNVKSGQLIMLPSLSGRRSGAIIKKITEFLLPGKFTYNFSDTMGEIQTNFEIKAGDVWSDLVAKCATNDRCHYWVQDGKIYYDKFNDSALGVVYDIGTNPALTGWNAQNITVSPDSDTIKNDIIVIGAEAPRGMGKAFYVGDGFQGNFYLQTNAYGIQDNIIVNENWQNGLNKGVWRQGLGTGIDFSLGNIQVNGGDGVTNTYIQLVKGIELSGSLRLVHGEFQFAGPSEALIGCLRSDPDALDFASIFSGFRFIKVGLVTEIQPIVMGQMNGDILLTEENHSYVLVTNIHYREIYPWRALFGSISDPKTYGSRFCRSQVFITHEIWDYDITTVPASPDTLVPKVTKPFSDLTDIPSNMLTSYLTYTLMGIEDGTFAVNFTELSYPFQVLLETKKPILDPLLLTPSQWEDLKVRSVGYGIDRTDATVSQDQTGHVLQFYPSPVENIPVAGEVMEIWFRIMGISLGRVQDPRSIEAIHNMYGDPDDGVRTRVEDSFKPTPRTDEDARNAAAAILGDSTKPSYQVSYKVFSDYVSKMPIPGRFLHVNEMRFEQPTDLLVSSVQIEMHGDLFTMTDKHFVTLKAGPVFNADVFGQLLQRKGPVLDPADVGKVDTLELNTVDIAYLQVDINDWGVQPYDQAEYEVTITDPPATGHSVEVRKWDRGWGQIQNGKDPGLIIRTNPGQLIFTIPRAHRDQFFFMRFRDVGGVYSSRSAYCKIGWPLIPKPVINLVPTYIHSAGVLNVVFDIPPTNFQDIWRIGIYAVALPAEDKLLESLIWDATTFHITRSYKGENPDSIKVFTYNLFGERSALVQENVVPGGTDSGVSEIQVDDIA